MSKSSLSLPWSAILLMQDNCSLHQNDVVDSPALAYNATADSSVCAASDVAVVFTVRLSRPGLHQYTGPRLSAWAIYWVWASHCLGSPVFFRQIGGKLSCIISRRLHWMAQWAGAQGAATTVWLTSNIQLEGTIGWVADMAHTGSFITRRSHHNLLWIHIVLSTPMIYKLCRFISWSNMENLKPTPRVTLRLGCYDDMTQQILLLSANLRTPGRWRER